MTFYFSLNTHTHTKGNPSKIINTVRCLFSPPHSDTVIRQEKEIKRTHIGKEEIKLHLFFRWHG